jgi:dihydrofolate reductase
VARFPDAGRFKYKLDEVLAHEAHLLGRRTYESFAGAWPARTGPFADKINSMPKYVASTTLATADWNNTTVLKGDTATAVATLKRELAGDILVAGSRTLVATLKQNDLVDEYRLIPSSSPAGCGCWTRPPTRPPSSLWARSRSTTAS